MPSKYVLVSICALGRSNFDNNYEIETHDTEETAYDTAVNAMIDLLQSNEGLAIDLHKAGVNDAKTIEEKIERIKSIDNESIYFEKSSCKTTFQIDFSDYSNDNERPIYTWIIYKV